MTSVTKATRRTRVLSRSDAARIVRTARRAWNTGAPEAGELIGWAMLAVRDSLPLRRMKIDYLLSIENYDSADALIAQTVMQGRDHELLRLRFVRSLHAQGRLNQAHDEMQPVVLMRPHDSRVLLLAGVISRDRGEFDQAERYFRHAIDVRPDSSTIRRTLIETLLVAGRTAHATEELNRMSERPVDLEARVLFSQGRTLDAVELLAIAVEENDASPNDVVFMELIDLLDETGDMERLHGLDESPSRRWSPAARVRYAKACLRSGDFERALHAVGALMWIPQWRNDAVAISLVARALNPQRRNEILAVEMSPTFSYATIAMLWLRGSIGRLTSPHIHARTAGADPAQSVLPMMLRQSIRTFEQALQDESLSPARQNLIEGLRSNCQQALGMPPRGKSSESTSDAIVYRENANISRRAA